MKVIEGRVSWNGKTDIPCTYGQMEDGRQFYFLKQLNNGNIIATTALIEAVDSATKAKNVGLIDKNGNEIISFVNSSIRPISEYVLLVEPAVAVSQNVIESNNLRMDPLSATKLVATPAQIKQKINDKMGTVGKYELHDQFKEGTLCDINGNNLVNGEYYSFIAINNDKVFMAKNYAETDVVEFSLTDKKVVGDVKEEVVTEPVQEEVNTEPVQEVEESVPVENVNEGFAKEDIDLGQEISIPQEEVKTNQLSSMFNAPVEVPAEEVASVTRGLSSMFDAPVAEKTPITSDVNLVNSPRAESTVENESFDELKEEAPVAEINSDEVNVEEEKKELTEEDMDDRESDLERRLNELNEKFNSMNSYISKIGVNDEKQDEEEIVDTKDVEEEQEEENVFTSPEIDNIDNINDEEELDEFDEIDDSLVDNNDTTMEDATKAIDALAQKYNEKNVELNEALEREEKLKASRKNYIEKAKAQEQKITLLNAKNHDLMEANAKLEAKIESLNMSSDLQKRKNEEQKRRIGELERENMRLSTQVEGKEELARALESVRALIGENESYDDRESYYKKVA